MNENADGFCGCRPHNDVKLATIQDSPVLNREGYVKNPFEASGNPVPTMEGVYLFPSVGFLPSRTNEPR